MAVGTRMKAIAVAITISGAMKNVVSLVFLGEETHYLEHVVPLHHCSKLIKSTALLLSHASSCFWLRAATLTGLAKVAALLDGDNHVGKP